jgi:hypothetical protein
MSSDRGRSAPRRSPISTRRLAELDGKGGSIVRVYDGPLVKWIWIDALIVMAGGH